MKYKVGDRVGHSPTFAWGLQGGDSDGTIKVIGSGLPYIVQWDNGELNSYNESDLIPATSTRQKTTRPTVGDRVRIISERAGSEYKGKCGIISRDDHDESPYRINIDGSDNPSGPCWFKPQDIEPEKKGLFIAQSRSQRRREILGRLTIE